MSIGLKQCEKMCLRNCSCMAYASLNSEIDRGTGCMTWHRDLLNARTFILAGQDLYLRVDANELAGMQRMVYFKRRECSWLP
ncbi:hypothetical protein F3Y22_tig00010533pilonHSYRG00412 [Hibiscus syriacus]|uniref:Apple domain-containing protein n=1 Tax=Hibiscus syriacus TaxID=106335 RepID=A0A6A3C9F1_HIBSY|nr:hypothetical protein F3Y22_tig00010533pilonHSYRG00412 [Hibiscus syriacus]